MTEPAPSLSPPRQPPNSLEAEQCLLGAMLLSRQAVDKFCGQIGPEDFYRETHRLIFRAITELSGKGEQVDAITVSDWFATNRLLDRVDGGGYVTMLANETPGAANVSGYLRIVREKSKARRLVEMGAEIADRAMQGEAPDALIDEVQNQILDWSGESFQTARTIPQIARSWLEQLESRIDQSQRIDTGLADVDRIVQGMLPSELVFIGGRPGMGKTAAAMSILEQVTRKHWAIMFSAEMSGEQLLGRWATAGGVESSKLRDPSQMLESDWISLHTKIKALKSNRLVIDDTAGISIEQMAARVRLQKRERDIRLVVVDYMQLVTAKSESRFDEVSRVSRGLKKLAKDMDIPVIALSQLSRKLEERGNKRPHLSDLRETGQIEQDADVVIFLYRHSQYDDKDDSGIAEWIVAKHRSAQTGTAYTIFQDSLQKFVNADWAAVHEYQNAQLPASSGQQTRWRRMNGND